MENELPLEFIDYDVLVCGGTLGIFLACSLQKRGFRVAVVERGVLKGRKQEWNISRTELEALERVLQSFNLSLNTYLDSRKVF